MSEGITPEEANAFFQLYETACNQVLDSWISFLNAFFQLYETACNQVLDSWISFLREAAPVLSAYYEEVGRIRNPEAADFNVFRATRRSGFEVTTHSAFLATLFDPRGNHGQGGLFLKMFLDTIQPKISKLYRKEVKLPPADGSWSIDPEFPMSLGRIDILLRCMVHHCSIAIENKISAKDQPAQLVRYWRWLKASSGTPAENGRNAAGHSIYLIYLTLSGREPRPEAFEGTDEDLVEEVKRNYIRLAYEPDLRRGFQRLIKETVNPPLPTNVEFVLRQYLEDIRRLRYEYEYA